MRRARSQTESPEYSRTSQFREWLGIVLGLFGAVVAILGYQESVKTRERSARVEAYVYLDTAWDLMGGQPGTSFITKPVSDRSSLEEAHRAIERALILDPDSGRGFRINGAYLRATSKLQEAIRSLETSLTLDPNDYRSHSALGILHLEARNYSQAEVQLTEAARLEPSDPDIFINLGTVSAKQAKFDRALSYYDKAIKLAPKSESVCNLKGAVLRSLGREREALMCFARAAELRRDFKLMDELMRSSNVKAHNPTPAPDC